MNRLHTMRTLRAARRPRRSPRAAHSGAILIEALVGILIFAIGVLGIVGLQASMTKAQTSSKFRGDAAYLASALIGTMWADNIALNLPKYATAQCAGYNPCNDWKNKVAAALPGGTSVVAVDAANNVSVTIQWTLPNEGSHSYTTSATLQP
jgi:type IV pilus assembly protein PilV